MAFISQMRHLADELHINHIVANKIFCQKARTEHFHISSHFRENTVLKLYNSVRRFFDAVF